MENRTYKPGDVVAGEYRIKNVIGSGGFSRVYHAIEERLGRDVALKIMTLRDGGTFDERVSKRFIREARLISQLASPHTVTLYDYDTLPDHRMYMVLEYVEGTTLDQYTDRRGLDADRIERILKQMLDALGEAHRAGVLHRDLKPTNVMLFDRFGQTDCVKLLDFGIAKKLRSQNALHKDLTVPGHVVGTPGYMSPEQLDYEDLTPASDLYNVGLLLYEMWSGNSPFPTTEPDDVQERMEQLEANLGELSDAPEPLKSVGAKLLKVDPSERYETAEEVLEALGHELGPGARGDRPSREPRDSVPPTFPVGFDRATNVPSSELTGVAVTERRLTPAAEHQLQSTVTTTLTQTPKEARGPEPMPEPEAAPSSGESAGPTESLELEDEKAHPPPVATETKPTEPEWGSRFFAGVAVATVVVAIGVAAYLLWPLGTSESAAPMVSAVPGDTATSSKGSKPAESPVLKRTVGRASREIGAAIGRSERRARRAGRQTERPSRNESVDRNDTGPTEPPQTSNSASESSSGPAPTTSTSDRTDEATGDPSEGDSEPSPSASPEPKGSHDRPEDPAEATSSDDRSEDEGADGSDEQSDGVLLQPLE